MFNLLVENQKVTITDTCKSYSNSTFFKGKTKIQPPVYKKTITKSFFADCTNPIKLKRNKKNQLTTNYYSSVDMPDNEYEVFLLIG